MKWIDLSGYNARLSVLQTNTALYYRLSPISGNKMGASLNLFCERNNMLRKGGNYAYANTLENKGIPAALNALPYSQLIEVDPELVGFGQESKNEKPTVSTTTNQPPSSGGAGAVQDVDGKSSSEQTNRVAQRRSISSGDEEESGADAYAESISNRSREGLSSGSSAGQLGDESGRGGDPSSSETRADPKGKNPNHFFLSDESVRAGGFSPKERFEENRNAVSIVNSLDNEQRYATNIEKKILTKFNGWGGLSQLFGRTSYNDPQWMRDARTWMGDSLEGKAYSQAKRSILNSHFTSPQVAREIWSVIKENGFKGGRILEPAAGSGVFLGTMPKEIADNSIITTIEKDALTASVVAGLFPDAKNNHGGFETVKLANSSFDLAITNVPFGKYGVSDKNYNQHHLSIHDYFIVKGIDKLKPDGIGVFITSRYTMDKIDPSARKLMAKKGDLIGAVRLPNDSQKAQAGADVVTDILIFKRRSKDLSISDYKNIEWLKTSALQPDSNASKAAIEVSGMTEPATINNYFTNDEHVVGQVVHSANRFGANDFSVKHEGDLNDWASEVSVKLNQQLSKNKVEIKETDIDADYTVVPEGRVLDASEFSGVLVGSIIRTNEGLAQVNSLEDDALSYDLLGETGKKEDRIDGMITVREAMNKVILSQINVPFDKAEFEADLKVLNRDYDDFTDKYGALNDAVNARLFLSDPESGRIRALELYDEETKVASKADIFTKRVIRPEAKVKIETPVDALNYVIAMHGKVDIERISALANLSIEDAIAALTSGNEIFLNPANDTWEIAAKYLSGDVKTKLELATEIAEDDKRFERNIQELEVVIPDDIYPEDIHVSLGASWLEPELLEGFFAELFDRTDAAIVTRLPTGAWKVKLHAFVINSPASTSTYGTSRMKAAFLIDKIVKGEPIAVYDTIRKVRILNDSETINAQNKVELIQQKFKDYLFSEANRETGIRAYNDAVNRYVDPEYDGSNLLFPGMSAAIELRDVQRSAVMRMIQDRRMILAHKVGVGKTISMIASAIESKRLGIASNPLIAVPNHMINQIHREGLQLYPNARVLAITRNDLKKDNRKTFIGKMINNEWDLIICTHGVMTDIPLDHEFVRDYVIGEIDEIKTSLSAANDADAKRFTIKQIETRLANAEAKLEAQNSLINDDKDQGATFSMLGIDWLAIDEFHNFKNLATSAADPSLSIGGSQRAADLHMKTKYLFDSKGKVEGLLLASGTPVSNNIAELFVAQRYIMPDVLAAAGMSDINSWAQSHIKFKSQFEPAPGGNGFKLRSRPVLVNAPELLSTIRQVMDVKTAADAGITLPKVDKIISATPMTQVQEAMTLSLAARAERLQREKVKPTEDNILKIVSEGRQLALHPALIVEKDFEDGDGNILTAESVLLDLERTKIDEMVESIVKNYHESEDMRGAQAVFCDMGTPSAGRKGRFNVYDLIKTKLVDMGLPAEQIAFVHSAKTDKQKDALFLKVREGAIRVVIGSTSKMGEGTNMQQRLKALHHLDPPWRPSDIEQRDGRIARFGNLFIGTDEGVSISIWTTKGSFDEYMWTTMKAKADVFSGILSGDKTNREFDSEVDPTFGEAVSIVTRNPLLKEKMEVEQEVNKLSSLSRGFERELHTLLDRVSRRNRSIDDAEELIERLSSLPEIKPSGEDETFVWTVPVAAKKSKSKSKKSKKSEETDEHLEEVEILDETEDAVLDESEEIVFQVVDRDKLAAKVGRIFKKNSDDSKKLKVGDVVDDSVTIYFEGYPVVVHKEPDEVTATWTIENRSFIGSAALSRAFALRDEEIESAHERIEYCNLDKEKTNKLVDSHGNNPYKDSLEGARDRLDEVESLIANDKGNKNKAVPPQKITNEEMPNSGPRF